jgi:prefoldin subunit 5
MLSEQEKRVQKVLERADKVKTEIQSQIDKINQTLGSYRTIRDKVHQTDPDYNLSDLNLKDRSLERQFTKVFKAATDLDQINEILHCRDPLTTKPIELEELFRASIEVETTRGKELVAPVVFYGAQIHLLQQEAKRLQTQTETLCDTLLKAVTEAFPDLSSTDSDNDSHQEGLKIR